MDNVLPFNELSSMPAGAFDACSVDAYATGDEDIKKLHDLAIAIRDRTGPLHARVNELTALIEGCEKDKDEIVKSQRSLFGVLKLTDETKEAVEKAAEDATGFIARKILDLETQRDQACNELSYLTTINRTFAKERMDDATRTLECPICLGGVVTHVFVPCGHTICEKCNGKLTSTFCALCRNYVCQKIRVFAS